MRRKLSKLHELFEIVRQSNDPDLAQTLNRIQEGNHTQHVVQIRALASTSTSSWSDEFIKLCITNKLVDDDNETCILNSNTKYTQPMLKIPVETVKLIPKMFRFQTQCPSSGNTGNFLSKLKICTGARIMLTDTSDRLMNGSIGTVKHIHMMNQSKSLYLLFDYLFSGKLLKNRRLKNQELRQYVLTRAVTKSFPFKTGRKTVTVKRK